MRHAHDFYETPAWMTLALLRRVPMAGRALECCAGDGAIARVLEHSGLKVITNDVDPARDVQYRLDASTVDGWMLLPPVEWVVTNPPFGLADRIVPLAFNHWKPLRGVAMLLRLSWLEPTAARSAFLRAHPPTRLVVLPRHDFKGNGQTDSVTSAWFVWEKGASSAWIEIVTKDERDALIALDTQK